MIKRICDKCGKEMKEDYYTLKLEFKSQNRETMLMPCIKNRVQEYCEECIKEIKKAGNID